MTNDSTGQPSGLQLRFRDGFTLTTIVALGLALFFATRRARTLERQLRDLQAESGYLGETPEGQIAAVRGPSTQPLTYQLRLRVPGDENANSGSWNRWRNRGGGPSGYRLAYSSMWRRDSGQPDWYAAVAVPEGDSTVTVRIAPDPRDGRWRIATLVATAAGTKRVSTILPEDQVKIFRGSHEIISGGIVRGQTQTVLHGDSLRLLEDKWLVGEGAMMLYGDRPPDRDQIGVYLELQPDDR